MYRVGIAIAAVAAFFYAFVWPNVQESIQKNICESECGDRPSNVEDGKCICE